MPLEPCHLCHRPALVGEGPGDTWQIGCFRDDCECTPITYRANSKRSRSAAIRTWNARRKKCQEGPRTNSMKSKIA